MKGTALFLLIALLGLPLFSETFECVFIDGYADTLEQGDWIPVDFGTILTHEGTLVLEEGSSVQLESPVNTLFFTSPGEYRLSELVRTSSPEDNQSFSSLGDKISALVQEQDPRTTTTVMGIRGSEMQFQDDLGFDSINEEDIHRAWSKIEAGDFSGAEEELEYLYMMSADPYSEGKLLFSLAYVEDMQGKSGEAWMHLGDIIMPERGDYYSSYLLLSGKLALKSRNFAEAKITFENYLRLFPDSDAAEEAELLLQMSK